MVEKNRRRATIILTAFVALTGILVPWLGDQNLGCFQKYVVITNDFMNSNVIQVGDIAQANLNYTERTELDCFGCGIMCNETCQVLNEEAKKLQNKITHANSSSTDELKEELREHMNHCVGLIGRNNKIKIVLILLSLVSTFVIIYLNLFFNSETNHNHTKPLKKGQPLCQTNQINLNNNKNKSKSPTTFPAPNMPTLCKSATTKTNSA